MPTNRVAAHVPQAVSNLPRFGTKATAASTDPGLSAMKLPHNAIKLSGTATSGTGTLELTYENGKTAKVTMPAGMSARDALFELRKQMPKGYLLPIDQSDAKSLIFGVEKLDKKNDPRAVTGDIGAARGPGTENGPVITKRELDALVKQAQRFGLTKDEKHELARGITSLLANSKDQLTPGARKEYEALARQLTLPSAKERARGGGQ
jgi:hypothetical protein